MPQTLEEATFAASVGEMLNLAFQNSGGNHDTLIFHIVVLGNYFQLLLVRTKGERLKKMKTMKIMVLLNHLYVS